MKKTHTIKTFKIESLFGTKDIEINFDSTYKILIGENGLGKTTVLNLLYYTLIGKFSQLGTINFKKLFLEFENGKSVTIEKSDLRFIAEDHKLSSKRDMRIMDAIAGVLLKKDRELIEKHINVETQESVQIIERNAHNLERLIGYPSSLIHRTLRIMFSTKYLQFQEFRKIVAQEMADTEILYFPTYRRIEEDLNKLSETDESKVLFDNKKHIQFGMEDVITKLNNVIDKIRSSSIIGFSELTGEMLSQYLEGTPVIDQDIKQQIAPEILRIILERVGTNIAKEEKERILHLVDTGGIFENPDYTHLLNFLSKLFKIYDQQKGIDNSIKLFEKTCNNYLNQKAVDYDESKVTIDIRQEKYDTIISLQNLSSGEKQIISLFTKIIFSDKSNIIVLFDEPELSLSIDWQRRLLPDVIKAKTCSFLLAVTHSPFIFDNELDSYAEDMAHCVKDSQAPAQPDEKGLIN